MNKELEDWQSREMRDLTPEAYDQEISRRLWRRRLRSAGAILGDLAFFALAILLAWLYLVVTPDQLSAECESLRAEMETEAAQGN